MKNTTLSPARPMLDGCVRWRDYLLGTSSSCMQPGIEQLNEDGNAAFRIRCQPIQYMITTIHPRYRGTRKLCPVALFAFAVASLGVAQNNTGVCTSGNGAFGAWTTDPAGLPAYDFKTAATASGAFHKIGNSAVTALAHPEGYVELFTNRTFPRIVNRYDESGQNWSGGFGWISKNGVVRSTLTPDARPGSVTLQRFGMGYFQREANIDGVKLVSHIFVPDGDDELLIERIVFTNTTAAQTSFTYFSYWDVAWWLPRFLIGGYDWSNVTTSFDPARQALQAVSTNVPGSLAAPNAFGDPSPKATFAAFLNTPMDAYDTVKTSFAGNGTRALPAAVSAGQLTNSLSSAGALRQQDSVLVTQKSFTLAPGQTAALYILYGVAPAGAQNTVIDKYRMDYQNRFASMLSRWSAAIPTVRFAGRPCVEREMAWHYYSLVSGALLEDYFGQHVLNQGSVYLYDWGQNISLRDPLQHIMPLIYGQPYLARETILYVLKATTHDGHVPYGISGHGAVSTMGLTPSDMSLWLILATTEYVNATRDYSFLDSTFRAYDGTTMTVYAMLAQAFWYQAANVGTGRHGLVKLLNADWNDLLPGLASDPMGTMRDGESTLNTALAIQAYTKLLELANSRFDGILSFLIQQQLGVLIPGLQGQWRGSYFNRAYINAGASLEVGNTNFWLDSNGAAVAVSGVTPAQAAAITHSIKTQVSDPSPTGMALQGFPLPPSLNVNTPNAQVLGGTWSSINALTIAGLAQVAGNNPEAATLAWTEFDKSTLVHHAELFPNQWIGIWSGPDGYFNELFSPSRAGQTWADSYPIANMHSHSAPLLSSLRLAGIRVSKSGVTIDPVPPYDTLSWKSQTLDVEYTPTTASISMMMLGKDTFTMKVKRPSLLPIATSVKMNGIPVTFQNAAAFVTFPVTSTTGGVISLEIR